MKNKKLRREIVIADDSHREVPFGERDLIIIYEHISELGTEIVVGCHG